MTDLRLAIFDCDGTLVDSQHAIIHSMEVAFSRLGLAKPAREDIRRIVGLPLADAISMLLPRPETELVEKVRAGYSDEWHKLRASSSFNEPLYPGTTEVLDALSRTGWLLGVATGKSYRGLVATLNHHQILDKFVTLQTSDKVSRGKPFPDMLLAALAEAGAKPRDAVMIGDTTFDMDMAVSAGVRAIGVNWGYHDSSELRARGAERVIDRFEDLLAVLGPEKEL